MAKTYNRLMIDVNQHINSIGIRPVKGDTQSRYLDVSLYENGKAIDLTKEQVRMCYAILATLDGLKQLGANGNMTDAYNKLEKHLNQSAHDWGKVK